MYKKDRPKAYQQGWIEFYKLRFKVTPDVLIPRPETELLVDEVLDFIQNYQLRINNEEFKKAAKKIRNSSLIIDNSLTILDLGTGSGNIAISIAKNLPQNSQVKILATDISGKALKVAKQNARLHGVENRIDFIQSNLLENCKPIIHNTNPQSLIIVTNLPYIPSERIAYLDSSVKDFEPNIALDGGADGFDLYRKLFAQINKKGWHPNLVIGEIDYTHGELAITEAQKYFPDAKIEVKTDLAKKQRVLLIG